MIFPKRGFAGPTTGSLPEFRLSQPHMRIFSNLKHFYMLSKNPESHLGFLRAWRVREPDKPKVKPALHTQSQLYGGHGWWNFFLKFPPFEKSPSYT